MQARLDFDAGSRARAARYFLLLAQEKVPKEKGTRTTHPLRGFPAFLANPGVAHNSQSRYARTLKQVRACSPDWLRYSVSATGGKSKA